MERMAKIMAVFCILVLCRIAVGDELHVPADYPTIQAGINAASDGDTVIVSNGTYRGSGNYNIDFKGKAITVRSRNGPEYCIIDCQNKYGRRGFYFHSGETRESVLSGFKIKRGKIADMPGCGGGIYCKGSSPTIDNCIIINLVYRFNNVFLYYFDSICNITFGFYLVDSTV